MDVVPAGELKRSMLMGLECLAIDPELRSALIFDASPSTMLGMARHLATMLEGVVDHPVETITLSSIDAEDSLWGVATLKPDSQGNWINWQITRLAQASRHPVPRLVVIPDLVRLSLPAARACVMLVGANTAALQRHGQNLVWEPNLWWIAGCARAEIGEVSPHLLDRFALRLFLPHIEFDRAGDIYQWVMQTAQSGQSALDKASLENSRQRLQRSGPLPEFPSALFPHLINCVGVAVPGLRREIALARLSRSIAWLDGDSQVAIEHINQAARLMGYQLPVLQPPPSLPESSQQQPGRTPAIQPGGKPEPAIPQKQLGETGEEEPPIDLAQETELVILPDTEITFEATSLPETPYPEDTAAVTRSADSLQLPQQRYQSSRSTEGAVIGTQRASTLHDIALVSTILEAAKFQKVRPAPTESDLPFRITRADLRCYRRALVPQQMLVVLMDYTCLKGHNWQDAIVPHLSWAYTARSSVCVIQVGSSHAKNYLCAEQITERNLLSPRIVNAFEEQPGAATPLAHGLDLAMRVLQNRLQHGRSRIHQARFVVVSDGRGNVPLAASLAGELTQSITREGIEDALKKAQEIAALKHVEVFVLNPQPKLYADLPILFAETLGATLQPITLLQGKEEGA